MFHRWQSCFLCQWWLWSRQSQCSYWCQTSARDQRRSHTQCHCWFPCLHPLLWLEGPKSVIVIFWQLCFIFQTHQQMGGSLTSSSGLPNPCCSVVTAADLSRASHQRPRKRLSGSSSESFNEMNMLSQVNMSGLRAATDEHRERGRRIGWVFLLTVCFAVMVVSLGQMTF